MARHGRRTRSRATDMGTGLLRRNRIMTGSTDQDRGHEARGTAWTSSTRTALQRQHLAGHAFVTRSRLHHRTKALQQLTVNSAADDDDGSCDAAWGLHAGRRSTTERWAGELDRIRPPLHGRLTPIAVASACRLGRRGRRRRVGHRCRDRRPALAGAEDGLAFESGAGTPLDSDRPRHHRPRLPGRRQLQRGAATRRSSSRTW